MDQIKQIIESLLFVSDSPLTVDHIQRAVPEAGPDAIQKALLELKEEYEVRNGGFLLHEVAGGFQFRTQKEFKEWIRRLFPADAAQTERSGHGNTGNCRLPTAGAPK